MNNVVSTSTQETTKFPEDEKFFESLRDYTINDIDALQDIGRTKITGGFGRCTTALAALCFSVIEQIGLLLIDGLQAETIEGYLHGKSNKKIESFCNFFVDKVDNSIQAEEMKMVFTKFRNRIIHNMFPDRGYSISQDANNGVEELILTINGTEALNVNCLSNFVRKAVQHLIDTRDGASTITRNLNLIVHR